MADRMLDQEGASFEEGGRRSRAPLPARTCDGTRIMTGRDNREKAAQAEAMSQQGVCTSQAAGPGAQEEPGQLSDSAQRQRKHRAKAAEQLRLRAESMQTAFAGMPRARLCSSCSCTSHDGSRGAEISPGIIWAGHQHGHRGNWRQQRCGNLTFVVSSCSVCIWSDVVVACCVARAIPRLPQGAPRPCYPRFEA